MNFLGFLMRCSACPLPLVCVEYYIVYFIGGNGETVQLFDDINSPPCLLCDILDHYEYQIRIWEFTLSGNLIKFMHIRYTLITRSEGVNEVSVVHQFLNK